MPSISADIVTTVVYGTAGTIIGVVTIFQSYVAWRLWHEHHHNSRQSSQDVELALGSALVVRQEPSNTESINVVHVHDTNTPQPVANLQSIANVVTTPTHSQHLGPSESSTTDLEPTEVGNESQAIPSPSIAPDAALTLPLQTLQTPELDVVPVQDTASPPQDFVPPQSFGYAENPSVSYPALHPPGVSASSNTPLHSTDSS